jgi:hypothetical protein
MNHTLTIAFAIYDENGTSILQQNAPNGASKTIQMTPPPDIAKWVMAVITKLAADLAQEYQSDNLITQAQLLDLKNTDEAAYIKALYAQIPVQARFQIKALENNQNEFVPMPTSLKQLQADFESVHQVPEKILDSSMQKCL